MLDGHDRAEENDKSEPTLNGFEQFYSNIIL